MNKEQYEALKFEAIKTDWLVQNEAKITNEKGLDNLILIVSTGVFSVSITFITGFARDIVRPELIIGAWVYFALAILFQAMGYIIGIYSAIYAQQVDDFDKEGKAIPLANFPRVRILSKLITILLIYVLICMMIGMIFLIRFASANLG